MRRGLIFLLIFAMAMFLMRVIAYAGIAGSRHDLSNMAAADATFMPQVMNNYGEVCVYCHTPHSGIANAGAPLWNKSITTANFNTYPTTMAGTTPATSISPESKVCLTCHDGTLAIDVIVNAPESGYNLSGPWHDKSQSPYHFRMQSGAGMDCNTGSCHFTMPVNDWKCGGCHSPPGAPSHSGRSGAGAYISTDLTNMHPISIAYSAPNADTYQNPGNLKQTGYLLNNTTVWKSRNRSANPTINDILINGKVECITCHDPHLTTYSVFLRATSSGSKICMACHDK